MRNHYRIDMAVTADDSSSMSNIFLRNSATYIEIPLYLQFRFNIASNVRWRVDAGFTGPMAPVVASARTSTARRSIKVGAAGLDGDHHQTRLFQRRRHLYQFSSPERHRPPSGHEHSVRPILSGRSHGSWLQNIASYSGGRGIITPNIHNFNYALTLGYRL